MYYYSHEHDHSCDQGFTNVAQLVAQTVQGGLIVHLLAANFL